MKNDQLNVMTSTNNYLKQFYQAQLNLNRLIYEERLQKRVKKSKPYLFKLQWVDQNALPL
ncbi:hypothetical protein [Chryseolinea sp. H1M3-3]|jgi:hypothetical protein|uniref:hypothetical protein n=1 Tax=Chryseolinea sp. H1M3-3 TaxID=3034144 RepID=UPI0023EC31DB|nr:hypothetical protein [Chryseolinea sp. H1M3-3]